jgi:hypothetical protein
MIETTETIESVQTSLNEYFKLKSKYESDIMKNKKNIINNVNLSNREKKNEYMKLKPKCINCKRPGGTIFKIFFNKETDTQEAYRTFKATCGVIVDPCILNIQIDIGKTQLIPDILNNFEEEIKLNKNIIIDDKNKLLFGFITSEEAIEKFENIKDLINSYTSLYEEYMNVYNNIIDNEDTKREMSETLINLYNNIEQIKDCIQKLNETDNVQYAKDAVQIYDTTLVPLLLKLRNLKYKEQEVFFDKETNTYNLIQNKYKISNLEYTSFNDKVASFETGIETKKNKKQGKKQKKILIVESNDLSEEIPEKIVFKKPNTQTPGSVMEENPEKILDRLPPKLLNALNEDSIWKEDLLKHCIESKQKNQPCKLIAPSNLIVPPEKLPNGNYDFGNDLYNEIFNKQGSSYQGILLTLFSEKDGVKNYNMLINTLNNLIERQFGIERGIY